MSGAEKTPDKIDYAARARERDKILREVSEHVARSQAHERTKQPRPKGTRRWIQLVNVVILAFAAYVWIGNPSWVQVETAVAPSPQEQEAALRLSMYIQAQQIENYRRQNNRIPSSLQEVGQALPGMHFQRVGRDTYRLTGVNSSVTLIYTSAEPLAEFLGESENVIFPETGGTS